MTNSSHPFFSSPLSLSSGRKRGTVLEAKRVMKEAAAAVCSGGMLRGCLGRRRTAQFERVNYEVPPEGSAGLAETAAGTLARHIMK